MAEPFNQQNAWADQEAARVWQCLAVHGNRFEYQKTLGRGAFGVACLIRHNRRDGTTRNFVVKRALSEKDQRNLQKEVDLAKEVGGGLHFALPIHVQENPLNMLGGPVMTMEYVANGTLGDFINRSQKLGHPLPNRLLWRLFSCLYRFVVGLAFPIPWTEGVEQEVERIPPDCHRSQGGMLVHGDMHPWNILIGDCIDDEHGKAPILKLVDFGQAFTHPYTGHSYNDAIAMNVFSVGEIMIGLIEQKPYTAMVLNRQGEMVPRYQAGEVWFEAGMAGARRDEFVATHAAHFLFNARDGSWRNHDADRALLMLVARCLAVAPRDRPGLRVLDDAIAAGRRPKASAYRGRPHGAREAAGPLARLVREVLLQAPALPRRATTVKRERRRRSKSRRRNKSEHRRHRR